MNLVAMLNNPVTAHKILAQAWAGLKPELILGNAHMVVVAPLEDDRSAAQNRRYWGFTLKQIAEQVSVAGFRYDAQAWHEYFKRQYMGYKTEKFTIAGSRRKRVRKVLKSTTDLSVRKFGEYMEKIEAHAVTELGVKYEAWTDPVTGEVVR